MQNRFCRISRCDEYLFKNIQLLNLEVLSTFYFFNLDFSMIVRAITFVSLSNSIAAFLKHLWVTDPSTSQMPAYFIPIQTPENESLQ